MLFSGRGDFSVVNIPGFILTDDNSDNARLGVITKAEVIQVAKAAGYTTVRFIMNGSSYTQEIRTGRLNVVFTPGSSTITNIWEG